MYALLVEIELALLLFLFLISWIAGVKASRLLYIGNRESMVLKTRRLLFWSWFLAIPAAAIGGIAYWMQLSFDPLFWQDRLYIHTPLVALPILVIWVVAVPNLWILRKMLKNMTLETNDDPAALELPVYQGAARPGLIVPFQMLPLGVLTALYFALVPPIPFQWMQIAIPLALFVLVTVALWWRHSLRSKQVGKSEVYLIPALWKRALTMTGVLAVIATAISFLMMYAINKSYFPAELSTASGVADYSNQTSYANRSTNGNFTNRMNGMTDSNAKLVSLVDPSIPRTEAPDRQFTLTAQKQYVALSSGKQIEAWTFNGQIPGPEMRVKEGELVEVTLVNQDIEQGLTLHWHGLALPNTQNSVSSATYNAVMPSETYTYRFRAEQAGTFWYYSPQDSQEATNKGLFGTLIVEAQQTIQTQEKNINVLTHTWKGGGIAIGESDTVERMNVEPGTPVRMRLINTDDWLTQTYTLVGTHFEVAALDGAAINKPGVLANTHLELTSGGRSDITFIMPEHPVFLSVGNSRNLGVFMTPDGRGDIPDIPATTALDPLQYGSPTAAPFGADVKFTKDLTLILDQKLGLLNGSFDLLNTLNGEASPQTSRLLVQEGELIKATIVNRGNFAQPMPLHGHPVLVLSRNGKPSKGSPWWSDSLNLKPGDTYEVGFIANQSDIWMSPSQHPTQGTHGLNARLMYEGITKMFSMASSNQQSE
ncbi:multicopper oxidase family protein [Paenibacillus sp. SYP-B3998]|uniref:Multicopper oxidase family protein n=1 Tax=Paenibacillus sp. SYP-B3998 TaxID=2678564 RepID=A0A6G4A0K3_9BACL|nr:multicopper oxidase family protein [Paenibacillus sp. SYP-B3998]NEW07464.1 multicopper oxidase family protein [Paenibacillus sp. SYP-B3998]